MREKSVLALRILGGLANRLAYSLLFGIATWLFAWLPGPYVGDLGFEFLLRLVNAPVAFVSRYLPINWQALDLIWGNVPHFYKEYSFLFCHLRTAVPVYLAIFYLPNLIGSIRRRLARRKLQEETGSDRGKIDHSE